MFSGKYVWGLALLHLSQASLGLREILEFTLGCILLRSLLTNAFPIFPTLSY
jgi:hypothetical protein